jgi:hypothetical protein
MASLHKISHLFLHAAMHYLLVELCHGLGVPAWLVVLGLLGLGGLLLGVSTLRRR